MTQEPDQDSVAVRRLPPPPPPPRFAPPAAPPAAPPDPGAFTDSQFTADPGRSAAPVEPVRATATAGAPALVGAPLLAPPPGAPQPNPMPRITVPPGLVAPRESAPLASPGEAPAPAAAVTRAQLRAQQAAPAVDAELDQTEVAARRAPRWSIVTEQETLALRAEAIVLGRRPGAVAAGEQAIALDDPTRTVSKRHARLVRQGESWAVIDLGSTNGVLLLAPDGTELGDAPPGYAVPLPGPAFLLGDLRVELRQAE